MSIFFTTNEGQENYILHSSPQSNKKRVIVHWGALNLFNASLFHPPQGPVKFSVFCKELGCFSTIQKLFRKLPSRRWDPALLLWVLYNWSGPSEEGKGLCLLPTWDYKGKRGTAYGVIEGLPGESVSLGVHFQAPKLRGRVFVLTPGEPY